MTTEVENYVHDLLARVAGCEAATLARVRQVCRRDHADETLLGFLVRRRAISRVAARAMYLAYLQKYDEIDIRQLVDAQQLRADLAAIAATTAGPDHTTTAVASRSLLALGERVGRYVIKGLLGGGASAHVYIATHPTLMIPVAVKVFQPLHPGAEFFADQFRSEAKLLARLQHPNIVRVWDLEEGEPPFMVLEYLDGPSLHQTLRYESPLSPQRLFPIAFQVARALRAAHKVGVVHCDVKPSNILTSLDGAVKLADFGIARLRGGYPGQAPASDACPALQGTLLYMAPEQLTTRPDHRGDVYSFGLVLYEALAGRHPMLAGSSAEIIDRQLNHEPEPLHRFCPGISPELSRLVGRMIDKDPDRRPSTQGDFPTELEAAFAAGSASDLNTEG